jgi:hypothetical protein
MYGLLLEFLFLGLGLHYLLTADVSPRSKTIVTGLLVAGLFFARWMPLYLALSIQIGLSAYILMVYRLQRLPSD